MIMTFPFFSFSTLGICWYELPPIRFFTGATKLKGDEARLERETLLDMISGNPQAVPNDLSLVAMLEHCSRR